MEKQSNGIGQQAETEIAARMLGRLVGRTGQRPSEAVIDLLQKDSRLLDAFIEGAADTSRQNQAPTSG